MACVYGKIKGLNVRVFKWNQKHNVKINPTVSESQGLFKLRVKNEIRRVSQAKDGSLAKHNTFTEQQDTIKFDYQTLNDKDSMECWLRLAISTKKLFPFLTIPKLARDISNYLFSCFRFNNIINQTSSNKPMILIIVHVYMLGVGCTRTMPSLPTHYSSSKDEGNGGVIAKKRKIADVNGDSNEIELFVGKTDEEEILLATLSQVQAAVKVKKFYRDESVDDDDDDDKCSICLERFKPDIVVATTPCSHVFHRDCVFQWLPKTGQCPLCRSFCTTEMRCSS
ncbi:hypothetical protein CsSME_00020789 [Camellia sinensis var. sinensis]